MQDERVAEVTKVLREHEVMAAHNAFAPAFLSPLWGQTEDWLDSIDIFLSECFDAFLVPCSDLNSTSVNVRWQNAVGKPAWILRTSAQLHYAHQPISKAQWLLYGAACKANGCRVFGPCGASTRPDTTTSPAMLANVKTGFDFFMGDSDLQEDAESAARIGLVFSWATRKYSPGGSMDWCEEFHGWARLLMEEHLPYNVVIAEKVTNPDDLAGYDLLVLPGITITGATFCSALGEFVRRGGRILATSVTSLHDEIGCQLPDFRMGSLLGVSWRGSVDGPFAIERPGEQEPAHGAFQQVETSGQVLSYRMEVDPAGSVGGMLDPLPINVSCWPAQKRLPRQTVG